MAALGYSNLGGVGPDLWAPPVIRYVGVGSVYVAGAGSFRFDLELSNRSSYAPSDASLNRINGRFAQVNLSPNAQVDLRVRVFPSCCASGNCEACTLPELSAAERDSCYASGCCCFNATCHSEECCSGAAREAARASYSCAAMSMPFVLPPTALVGMSVFDFDGGVSGQYVERLTLGEYEYFKTPLLSREGEVGSSAVAIDLATGTFSSTEAGTSSDNPSDPTNLTATQARRSVQFFFRPKHGYIDATFAVSYSGAGSGEGRNLLFAGDSSLCLPPPH